MDGAGADEDLESGGEDLDSDGGDIDDVEEAVGVDELDRSETDGVEGAAAAIE